MVRWYLHLSPAEENAGSSPAVTRVSFSASTAAGATQEDDLPHAHYGTVRPDVDAGRASIETRPSMQHAAGPHAINLVTLQRASIRPETIQEPPPRPTPSLPGSGHAPTTATATPRTGIRIMTKRDSVSTGGGAVSVNMGNKAVLRVGALLSFAMANTNTSPSPADKPSLLPMATSSARRPKINSEPSSQSTPNPRPTIQVSTRRVAVPGQKTASKSLTDRRVQKAGGWWGFSVGKPVREMKGGLTVKMTVGSHKDEVTLSSKPQEEQRRIFSEILSANREQQGSFHYVLPHSPTQADMEDYLSLSPMFPAAIFDRDPQHPLAFRPLPAARMTRLIAEGRVPVLDEPFYYNIETYGPSLAVAVKFQAFASSAEVLALSVKHEVVAVPGWNAGLARYRKEGGWEGTGPKRVSAYVGIGGTGAKAIKTTESTVRPFKHFTDKMQGKLSLHQFVLCIVHDFSKAQPKDEELTTHFSFLGSLADVATTCQLDLRQFMDGAALVCVACFTCASWGGCNNTSGGSINPKADLSYYLARVPATTAISELANLPDFPSSIAFLVTSHYFNSLSASTVHTHYVTRPERVKDDDELDSEGRIKPVSDAALPAASPRRTPYTLAPSHASSLLAQYRARNPRIHELPDPCMDQIDPFRDDPFFPSLIEHALPAVNAGTRGVRPYYMGAILSHDTIRAGTAVEITSNSKQRKNRRKVRFILADGSESVRAEIMMATAYEGTGICQWDERVQQFFLYDCEGNPLEEAGTVWDSSMPFEWSGDKLLSRMRVTTKTNTPEARQEEVEAGQPKLDRILTALLA
ncbi:hypothetical protein JCM11641_006012 [Rhodosporidiobolus odoratus]